MGETRLRWLRAKLKKAAFPKLPKLPKLPRPRPKAMAAWIWQARRRIVVGLLSLIAAPFVLVGVLALFTPLPSELREPAVPSLRVVSSRGSTSLLREVRTDDGVRARPLPLSQFPSQTRGAVLAAEDRHFYSHVGVDVTAVCRATASNIRHRKIVSGASTITMQLARTLRPHPRSLWGKVTEMALAVRIEASLSKDQILEEYLNRVIYGPNLRGYAAASHAYFDTAPESLSLAEAALIAGLPRGPSLYAVTKRPDLARKRRDRVLARMAEASMIDEAARDRAMAETIVTTADRPTFGAPHLVRGLVMGGNATAIKLQPALSEALSDRRGTLSEIVTTIDPDIQRVAENAVMTTLTGLRVLDKHVTAAAVVVLDNATGDVLAYVGSPDFFDNAALGQNDGVMALRQPGSSLKPFVYAEAMSSNGLGYTGATVLPDVEIHIPLPGGGDYVPHDYDAKLRGPVRLREALGNSLNVPAVYTIHQLGTQRVLDRLHAFGFDSLTQDAEHYGPALALGDGEVTLLELANAYATLAREGVSKPVRIVTRLSHTDGHWVDFGPSPSRRVLEPRVARMLTDILSDKNARMSAFGDQNVLEFEGGLEVAAKTGTSKGYRDNVAVGYTRDITVATWVGNFDGSPMAEVSGITGAGPIFHAVMEAAALMRRRGSTASPALARLALTPDDASRVGLSRTAVCALSGEIPTTACPHRVYEWLPTGDADHAPTCTTHERVRIDIRNGLRAGPDCTRAVTEERVFERWRGPYDAWAERTGRPMVPSGSSPECPVVEPSVADAAESGVAGSDPYEAPRITYPFDGAKLVIDPDRPPSLQMLDIKVDPDNAFVQLRIDGAILPMKRSWMLVPGPHTITAHRGSQTSTPVHITVR